MRLRPGREVPPWAHRLLAAEVGENDAHLVVGGAQLAQRGDGVGATDAGEPGGGIGQPASAHPHGEVDEVAVLPGLEPGRTPPMTCTPKGEPVSTSMAEGSGASGPSTMARELASQ